MLEKTFFSRLLKRQRTCFVKPFQINSRKSQIPNFLKRIWGTSIPCWICLLIFTIKKVFRKMFKLKIQCECDKIKIYAWNRKNLHILFQSTCGITDIMILFSFLSDLEDREFQFVYVFPLLSKRTKNCSKESAGNSTKIKSFKCFVIQDFEKEPNHRIQCETWRDQINHGFPELSSMVYLWKILIVGRIMFWNIMKMYENLQYWRKFGSNFCMICLKSLQN